MNYKILLLLAFALLSIGGIGIAVLSGDDEEETVVPVAAEPVEPVVVEPVVNDVIITLVKLKSPVAKGDVILAKDVLIEDVRLPETDPMVQFNSADFLANNGTDLHGFIADRDLAPGVALKLERDLISPNDPAYFSKALDLTQYTPYRVNVDGGESHLLSTVTRGSYVQLYTVVPVGRGGKSQMVPVSAPLQVVDVRSFLAPQPQSSGGFFGQGSTNNGNVDYAVQATGTAGFFVLKLSIKEMPKFARLEGIGGRLIPVPVDPNKKDAFKYDSKGAFINQLQGQ